MPDPELDSANESRLSRGQRWIAYVVGGLLGLALLALAAASFT